MLIGKYLLYFITRYERSEISEDELKLQFLRSNIDIEVHYPKDEYRVYYTLRYCGYPSLSISSTKKKLLHLQRCDCSNPDEVMRKTLDNWLSDLGILRSYDV